MQEQELAEQSDGGVPVEAANDRARPDGTRESRARPQDRDADRRALADALRFLHSSDDPEPFSGQFDPFDGGRMERAQGRHAASSSLTDRLGGEIPPFDQLEAANRKAAASISPEEIERLEQDMIAIDESWGGCEPEPVLRSACEQSKNSVHQSQGGAAASGAMSDDAEADARQSQAIQEEPETSASSQSADADPPPSGNCDSHTAGRPPGNTGLNSRSGPSPDARSGGNDREPPEAAVLVPRRLGGMTGSLPADEDDPFGFGDGSGLMNAAAEEASGVSDSEAEAREFDEVGARMAIRDDAEFGSAAEAFGSSVPECGAPCEGCNETRETKQDSGSEQANSSAPASAVACEPAIEGGAKPSRGAIEDSGPERDARDGQASHRPESGPPIKAAAILAAGAAISVCMLAFEWFAPAGVSRPGELPDEGETAEVQGRGIPGVLEEPEEPQGYFRDTAGTRPVSDSGGAGSVAVPHPGIGLAETSPAFRSSAGALEFVPGSNAGGTRETDGSATTEASQTGLQDSLSAMSSPSPSNVFSFPIARGAGMGADGDRSRRTMSAEAESGNREFGPPFGFAVAGKASTVPFRGGRTAELNQPFPAEPLSARKTLSDFDSAEEGCRSGCEAPEAQPSIRAMQAQTAAAAEIVSAPGFPIGSRFEGTLKSWSDGAADRLGEIKTASASEGLPNNAIAPGGDAEEVGAAVPFNHSAGANERIVREITELREETRSVAGSLRSRIGAIEAKLEGFETAHAPEIESGTGPNATVEAKAAGIGSHEAPAAIPDKLESDTAVRRESTRSKSYVIAAGTGSTGCLDARPPGNSPETADYGCGHVLGVVDDGFGGWLVVAEHAVIRLD